MLGQQGIYDRPPEFIQKHGIKRMFQVGKSVYHVEKNILPDSTQLFEFNREGNEVFSTNYLLNERYYWNKRSYDSLGRLIKNERYKKDGLNDASEIHYLPNGDYIQRFYRSESPDQFQYYAYFFDENGNEIRSEVWNQDSVVLSSESNTYNTKNRILSSLSQRQPGDTTGYTRYFYKHDTILVRKEYYHKDELRMRTKFEYFPDGKEKATHFGDELSWYLFYDDQGRIEKKMMVRYDQKDTVYTLFSYNQEGLISSEKNVRKNILQRREVYNYENNREVSKTSYTRGNTLNMFMETVYFGDTAKVIYQTPYWEKKAAFAEYQRIDAHGNVLESFQGNINGKKQSLHRWMKDIRPDRYYYAYSETGKMLAKYRDVDGWPAESEFCQGYTDDQILKGLNRSGRREDYLQCDTIRTRRHADGKEYVVALKRHTNFRRHIYENKNGQVDSIIDMNKSGTILNRMIKENGVYRTYYLVKRYEYTKMDSLQKVFTSFGYNRNILAENMTEEHFWKDGKRIRIKQFMDYSGRFSLDDETTIIFEYDDHEVFKTTIDAKGKIKEARFTYDENGRLIEQLNLDRLSGNLQVKYTYDEQGNLLEQTETSILTPSEMIYTYEFFD